MLKAPMIAAVVAVTAAAAQETAHLSIATSASAVAAKKATLRVDVEPKPNMHVYAPGQKDYIVIQLKLDENPAIVAAKAKFPAPEKYTMPALNETQLVYSKPFRITQDVTLKSASGPVTIKGTLRYQACDDKICYIPQNVPVSWTVGGK